MIEILESYFEGVENKRLRITSLNQDLEQKFFVLSKLLTRVHLKVRQLKNLSLIKKLLNIKCLGKVFVRVIIVLTCHF